MMTVSVIIPTYNRAGYIEASVNSALNQTVRDIDVWVVDDGSTDNTADIIKQINDSRLNYLCIDHSGLPAVPRNVGITRSQGNFIAFLDSDDLWVPQKLEKQLNAAKDHPDAGLYYSLAESFDEKGSHGPSVDYQGPRSGKLFDQLLFMNFVPILTVMVPRHVISAVGPFDERPDFRAIEDYDLILRIAAKYPLYCTPEILGRHRSHRDNIWIYDLTLLDRWKKVLKKNLAGLQGHLLIKMRALTALALKRLKYRLRSMVHP